MNAATPARTRRAIADGVHEGMVSALGIPKHDRFQIIDERPLTATGRDDWSFGNGGAQVLDTELLTKWGWTPPASLSVFKTHKPLV